MYLLQDLVHQYLCLPLKERVLSFIEDETWMLSKKHACVVMYIQHTIPKIHRRLYHFLVRIRQRQGLKGDMKHYTRMTRLFRQMIKRCQQIRFTTNTMICACICNQTRLLCAYSNIYSFSERQRQTVLHQHQRVHTVLSSTYPAIDMCSMAI